MNTDSCAYDLSIIIVTYDSNKEVADCLASIEEFSPLGRRLEVVVVDNKPTTGLKEEIAAGTWQFDWQYVANPKNDGFGAGNNRGVEKAKSQRIFFLNPDTMLLDREVLTKTIEKLNEKPEKVVGYTLVDLEGNPTDSYSYFFEDYLLFPLFNVIRRLNFYACNRYRFLQRRLWPWGAAFAINKETFIAAGCFDEQMFLCNEEPDLMKRIPKREIEILLNRIVHLEGHGREVPVSRYLASFRSLEYYFHKYRFDSRGYWRFFGWRLRLKRTLRRPVDANLWEAFRQMQQELRA